MWRFSALSLFSREGWDKQPQISPLLILSAPLEKGRITNASGGPRTEESAFVEHLENTYPQNHYHIATRFYTLRKRDSLKAVSSTLLWKWWPAGQCSKTGFFPILTITVSSHTWSRILPILARDLWRRRPRPAAPNAPTLEVREKDAKHRCGFVFVYS